MRFNAGFEISILFSLVKRHSGLKMLFDATVIGYWYSISVYEKRCPKFLKLAYTSYFSDKFGPAFFTRAAFCVYSKTRKHLKTTHGKISILH